MKCLSLWQPWATLIAVGAKKIETRSWKPPMERGVVMPLAIHAAKKWDHDLRAMCGTEPFRSILGLNWSGSTFNKDGHAWVMPLGSIVAVADLVGWMTTEQCVRGTGTLAPISEQERAFGDYSVGRFGWLLANVRRLPEPIPYRGAQGLFDIPDSLIPPR